VSWLPDTCHNPSGDAALYGENIMALTLQATFENGTLKLPAAVPLLKDGDRVWVTLHISSEEDVVQKSYGIIGWTGDSETVQRVALDPNFDVLESP
jgi:hypothetical protein